MRQSMIVRCLTLLAKLAAFAGAAFALFVLALLLLTGTVVFAAQPDPSLPAVARISCDTARRLAGRFGNSSEDEIREEMTRWRVTEFDMIAIMDRCNIKPEKRR